MARLGLLVPSTRSVMPAVADGRDTDIIAKNDFPRLTNSVFIVWMNALFSF